LHCSLKEKLRILWNCVYAMFTAGKYTSSSYFILIPVIYIMRYFNCKYTHWWFRAARYLFLSLVLSWITNANRTLAKLSVIYSIKCVNLFPPTQTCCEKVLPNRFVGLERGPLTPWMCNILIWGSRLWLFTTKYVLPYMIAGHIHRHMYHVQSPHACALGSLHAHAHAHL